MAIKYLDAKRIQGDGYFFEIADANPVELTLNGGTWRAYALRVDSDSSLIGKTLTQFTIKMKRTSGTSTTALEFGIFDTTGYDLDPTHTFVAKDPSGTVVDQQIDLTTSYQVLTCTGSRVLAENDGIGVLMNSVHPISVSIDCNDSATKLSGVTDMKLSTGVGWDGTQSFFDDNSPIMIGGVDDKATITDVPVGSQFEETDTRKFYQMLDAWVTTAGTLSAAVYIPTGRGDKTDGWTTTGQVSGDTHRMELDVWNGTTWSDNETPINIKLNASTSAGKVSAGIICAGSSTGNTSEALGCTRFYDGSWTTKADTPVQSGYGFGGGTATNFMHGGGTTGSTEIVRCDSWAENSWTDEGNLPSDGTTDGVAACAGDGTSLSTMFVAGGRAESYADTVSTAEYDGTSWSSSPADLSVATSANIGGGNKNGFWKCGGQPSADRGKVSYYNGTAWSSKPDTLYAFGGNAGGANNGGTNPLVSGGKFMPVNGNWTSGQYFGTAWVHRGST